MSQQIIYKTPVPKFATIGGTCKSADDPCPVERSNICPPIASPNMKQSQTDPPITAALPHFRCIKWPAPGKNQAATPTSQARAGVGSLASTLFSILLKFRPSIICTFLFRQLPDLKSKL